MAGFIWWKAVIEIILLAGGVYLVLRFLRGSRGAVILRGAAILFGGALFLLLFATEYLQLTAIQSLVSQGLTVAAIALVVIFQPDLRRALERLGESSVLHIFARGQPSVIEEIVDAVEQMARRKIGALIALEREVGLKTYAESGVSLDAEVSSELLVTIFYPSTPLSDGAVVIRGNRIVAAGCLLPLSEARGLPPEYGTRHRAGIGISEDSDAISIIVSEERGEISLAVRGEVQRNLGGDELQRIMQQLQFERSSPGQNRESEKPAETSAL